jgi:hypothetical protein
MRLKPRTDGNHSDIVKALRDAGASVRSLAQVGHGTPDLLVGWRGRNFLFEIKDPTRKPSERQLTTDEKAWHYTWNGQVCVIEKVEDAFKIMSSEYVMVFNSCS